MLFRSGSREALEALVSPLPEGPLAERAAVYLQRLHGACYGDVAAIGADLLWLEANGFTSALPQRGPIQLAPVLPRHNRSQPEHGGVLEASHDEVKKLERILLDHFQGEADILIHADPCTAPECPVCGVAPCDERREGQTMQRLWISENLTCSGTQEAHRPSPHQEK